MKDDLDPSNNRMTAERDDPAKLMQERRMEKERRKSFKNPTPPPATGERRHKERRAYPPTQVKQGSGLLSKLTFVLLLGAAGGAGFMLYQQNTAMMQLTQTNQATNTRIAELESQLEASDTLLEQTGDVANTSVNLTKTEIRRLWESAQQNKNKAETNSSLVSSLKSSLDDVNKQLKALSTNDEALTKKDNSINWLANEAKKQAASTESKISDIDKKIKSLNALTDKVAQIDTLSDQVAQFNGLAQRISIIDELEVAISAIKPTDTSAIESTQVKIINAQNQLLSAQTALANDQGSIKTALELVSERITNIELAIDVIDDHRMRMQQDLGDLKQTP